MKHTDNISVQRRKEAYSASPSRFTAAHGQASDTQRSAVDHPLRRNAPLFNIMRDVPLGNREVYLTIKSHNGTPKSHNQDLVCYRAKAVNSQAISDLTLLNGYRAVEIGERISKTTTKTTKTNNNANDNNRTNGAYIDSVNIKASSMSISMNKEIEIDRHKSLANGLRIDDSVTEERAEGRSAGQLKKRRWLKPTLTVCSNGKTVGCTSSPRTAKAECERLAKESGSPAYIKLNTKTIAFFEGGRATYLYGFDRWTADHRLVLPRTPKERFITSNIEERVAIMEKATSESIY